MEIKYTTYRINLKHSFGISRSSHDFYDIVYFYIVDGETQIAINDGWIEENMNWGDGSFTSLAVAVEKNTSGTTDYYQLAVKQTDTFTNWWTGEKQTNENWQIYAIDLSGNTNWDSTIWTQSISDYEDVFGMDLDGSGGTGIDAASLNSISSDTYGSLLKKDDYGSLFIVEDTTTVAIKDSYGGSPSFDNVFNWGSGSHSSESYAVEKKNDDTYSLAIKHTNKNRNSTFTDWEIFTLSSSGVLDWSNVLFTDDISSYETSFGEDLDGDGNVGIVLTGLSSVGSDTEGDIYKKILMEATI